MIVTSKLLTGFDAPILQVMYLDKPMRDHNLLQAICRTNRVYSGKTHGLIVDYLGIFDEVASALDFDEKAVQKVITNLDGLKKELPDRIAKCLSFFPNVDRTVGGYEGLIAAQEHLPDNETRDSFAAEYSVLSPLGSTLSGPESAAAPDRLQMADPGLRVGQAAQRQRQAALACARSQDHRTGPRERASGDGA